MQCARDADISVLAARTARPLTLMNSITQNSACSAYEAATATTTLLSVLSLLGVKMSPWIEKKGSVSTL